MADQIPPMPTLESCRGEGDDEVMIYAQKCETHARDLTARLAASNALCAELAEALEGTVKELEEVIKSAESEIVHFDGDGFHERLTAGIKALAKFKETTR